MNEPVPTARRQLAVPAPGSASVLPSPLDPAALSDQSRRWRRSIAAIELAPGLPLAPLRRQARQSLVGLARRHTASYLVSASRGDLAQSATLADEQPLILSGHQPTLFHPGVWFKNFLLGELAAALHGIGVHFLVDQDAADAVGLQTPHRTPDSQLTLGYCQIEPPTPAAASSGHPSAAGSVPWELRWPSSMTAWEQFPQHLAEELSFLNEQTRLLDQLWPTVIDRLRAAWPVGAALSAGRHRIEHDYLQRIAVSDGSVPSSTSELPLSQLCQEPPFADFCWAMLSQIERLHSIYNRCRDHYRQEHRVSNPTQPVAQLGESDGWLESPFWVYSHHRPQRRSLWVRPASTPGSLELSDRAGWRASWFGQPAGPTAAGLLASFQSLQQSGICVRPKALMTTLFARLCLGDIFIHGIGGGLYDAMTEAICRQMWHIELCPVVVASATFCLPISDPAQERRTASEILQQAWRAWHQPERLLGRTGGRPAPPPAEQPLAGDAADQRSALAQLVREKQRLLAAIPPRGQKLAWHQQLMAVNAELRERLHVDRHAHLPALRRAEAHQRQQRVVRFREYSLALFPPQPLLDQLRRCARQLISNA